MFRLPLAFLLVCAIHTASADSSAPCSSELLRGVSLATAIANYEALAPKNLQDAIEVLTEMHNQEETLPLILQADWRFVDRWFWAQCREFSSTWENRVQAAGPIPARHTLRPNWVFWRRLHGTGGGASDVFLVHLLPGLQKQVFRPVSPDYQYRDDTPRKAIALSLIAKRIGVDSYPESQIVELNGVVGTLSEYIRGKSLPLSPNEKQSHNELTAITSLVGDIDLVPETNNLRIDPTGDRALQIDPSEAFFWRVGLDPRQDFYSQRFVNGLLAYAEPQMLADLSDHLTAIELDALFFRRRLLLQDIRRRGQSAIKTNF